MYSEDLAEDVDRYMRYIELGYKIKLNFLNDHPAVDGRKRGILVDWLFHVGFLKMSF